MQVRGRQRTHDRDDPRPDIGQTGNRQPPPTAVTVGSHDVPTLDSTALGIRLARTAGGTSWDVVPGDATATGRSLDVVVCSAPSVPAVVRCHPTSVVIAIVAGGDVGAAVLAALQAGATTCVRGDDQNLIAAFVLAVARRRGLTQ